MGQQLHACNLYSHDTRRVVRDVCLTVRVHLISMLHLVAENLCSKTQHFYSPHHGAVVLQHHLHGLQREADHFLHFPVGGDLRHVEADGGGLGQAPRRSGTS